MQSASANANFDPRATILPGISYPTLSPHCFRLHYNAGNVISSGEFRIGGWVGMQRVLR